ncbi:MAG TPA: SAM-dependent methyltransferase [Steroidobacteraceae bacterium]|nr:SAM-dependent methyltransferase [Steroidobacteraceae bacterium]
MTRSASHSILPPVTPEEQRQSAAVSELIRGQIEAAGGVVSFESFMEAALYAPGLGYYSAGATKIGAGGDFVTAPEVSELFGRCVARQCAQVLSSGGGEILEIGAGTGRLAATLLQALAETGVLPQRYAILEVSADLASRQRAQLQKLPPSLRDRVAWLDRLPETPLRGVILANEVLDALPFSRIVLRGGELHELGVAMQDGAFVERERPPSAALAQAWSSLADELPVRLPEGYRSEICLRIEPWIAGVGACLESGLLLLLDYGLPRAHYYHPERNDGTLRCHFKQRAHSDPFANVGVQDITAWVDFTRVAEAAVASNLEVLGFVTQAAFLLATGIEEMAAQSGTILERVQRAGEARKLLLPGEMGEAFKVMALGKDHESLLTGFSLQDLRRSL